MMKIIQQCIAWYLIMLSLTPSIAFMQDVVDSIFQPSKNLNHIINIWNNKNAVGNEIFRGTTDVDINTSLSTPKCFMTELVNQEQCEAQPKNSRTRSNGKCYIWPASSIDNENRCRVQWWERIQWKDIGWSLIMFEQRPPLIVRITQTLMRLTIALSIPVLIYVGVKVIKDGLTTGDYKWALKEVSNILLWLALALSAIGIIYIIQSIVVTTLPGIFT